MPSRADRSLRLLSVVRAWPSHVRLVRVAVLGLVLVDWAVFGTFLRDAQRRLLRGGRKTQGDFMAALGRDDHSAAECVLNLLDVTVWTNRQSLPRGTGGL